MFFFIHLWIVSCFTMIYHENKGNIKIIGRCVCRKNSGGGRGPPYQCREVKGIEIRSLNVTKRRSLVTSERASK